MKKLIIILSLLILSCPVFSQYYEALIIKEEIDSETVRNIVGFVPSKANKINGWAISWFWADNDNSKFPMIVNGLSTDISPTQVVGVMLLPYMIGAIYDPTALESNYDEESDSLKTNLKFQEDRINGLSISVLDLNNVGSVNGIKITGLYYTNSRLNGISISLGESLCDSFNGIMISGILNQTHSGKGLQIGLINRSKRMKGVQIGLWNKIGNRGFPIINIGFKKRS